MTNIVIIGGRGNGTVIASTIEDCKSAGEEINCVGFLNDNESEINNYPVLGGIQNGDWKKLPSNFKFIYAMTNVKMAHERYDMLLNLKIPTERYATVVHPSAVVSKQAYLGYGVVLMPFTVVSPNARIGNHSQMYAQSFLGHDSELEEMVFVANNASIGGRVKVHNGVHIGSNASILERIILEQFCLIGLGSVVVKSVNKYEKVVGNPARIIGKIL